MSTDPEADALARSLGPLAPRAAVRARVLADVERTPQEAPLPARRPFALAAAAAAAVLGVVLWLVAQRGPEPTATDPRPAGAAAARAPWEEPPEVATERALNEACYEREKERLRREHAGKWAVIAHGRLIGVPEARETPATARDRGVTAAHAFVFRVGEDGPREDFISEWYAPRFAGTGLPQALRLEWSMHDRALRREDHEREQKGIGSLFPRFLFDFEGPPREAGKPGPRLAAREVFVGTVGPPLMLAPEDAVALDLARWEIPGLVTIWNRVKCRQATVLVSVAGWDAPRAITALWPLEPRANLVLWAWRRNGFWNTPFRDRFLAEAPDPDGTKPWILFGRDRVLARGSSPDEALLTALLQDREVSYHRILLRWPREPALVLREAEFAAGKATSAPNGLPLATRAAGPTGPFLVDAATAATLGLELAEEGRELWLEKTDGTRVSLRGGYAQRVENTESGRQPLSLTLQAYLVVYPWEPPPPPPPSPRPGAIPLLPPDPHVPPPR
jgi:hypothetical protein